MKKSIASTALISAALFAQAAPYLDISTLKHQELPKPNTRRGKFKPSSRNKRSK